MKYFKGILLGLVTGVVIGLIVYYRSLRLRDEDVVIRRYTARQPTHPPAAAPAAFSSQAAPMEPPSEAPAAFSLGAAPRDRLEKIRGIGPVYARRLQAGGVRTFTDLAGLTPERLLEILGPTRLPVDPQSWIDEARAMSQVGG